MTRPALSPASTRADRLEQLEGGLQDLACDQCGAAVRVKKLSPQHTSVQWSTRSVRQCAEFALRAGDGRPTALSLAQRFIICGSSEQVGSPFADIVSA